MFTGIIEQMAKVVHLKPEGTNLHITLESIMAPELRIDQSVAHNGVCLTVVEVTDLTFTVTAIEETLQRTNLKYLKNQQLVNVERSLKLGDRIDGHMVQGHVDTVAELTEIQERDGSWWLTFQYPEKYDDLLIEKGSVAVNGISLTVAKLSPQSFSVAIIPYTWQHTNLQFLWVGDQVNIEFDMAAKYYIQAIKRYALL